MFLAIKTAQDILCHKETRIGSGPQVQCNVQLLTKWEMISIFLYIYTLVYSCQSTKCNHTSLDCPLLFVRSVKGLDFLFSPLFCALPSIEKESNRKLNTVSLQLNNRNLHQVKVVPLSRVRPSLPGLVKRQSMTSQRGNRLQAHPQGRDRLLGMDVRGLLWQRSVCVGPKRASFLIV